MCADYEGINLREHCRNSWGQTAISTLHLNSLNINVSVLKAVMHGSGFVFNCSPVIPLQGVFTWVLKGSEEGETVDVSWDYILLYVSTRDILPTPAAGITALTTLDWTPKMFKDITNLGLLSFLFKLQQSDCTLSQAWLIKTCGTRHQGIHLWELTVWIVFVTVWK